MVNLVLSHVLPVKNIQEISFNDAFSCMLQKFQKLVGVIRDDFFQKEFCAENYIHHMIKAICIVIKSK